MEISKILTADVLDIIFDGKNKAYGAYDLRKTYAGRMRKSMFAATALIGLLLAGYYLSGSEKILTTTIEIPDEIIPENFKEPEVEEPKLPPPPAEKLPDMMQRKNVAIVVVPDEQVKKDDMPPPVEELENAKISLVNKDGPAFDNIVAPPAEDAVGKGIIAPPSKPKEDSVFLKVEVDASYPGGQPQWARFLNRSLSNNYPQDAADNGIQGKVVIQFIVDVEGNVSNVHAVSGPGELHDIAIKTIKKSGKWNPAQQNGQKVKAYKSQPIIFQIPE